MTQEFTAFDQFDDFPGQDPEELAEKGQNQFLKSTYGWEWNENYLHNANVEAIRNYCEERNIPATAKNLTYAFLNLKEQGRLVKTVSATDRLVRPCKPGEILEDAVAQPQVRVRKPGEVIEEEPWETADTTAEPPDTGDEAKRLAGIAGDPHATSDQRNEATRKLKRLAVQDRYARKKPPTHHDQRWIG